MKMSNKGIAMLAASEGLVINPYKDSVGVLTFGIGHTANAGSPNPSTMATVGREKKDERVKYAIEVFKKDIAKFENRVNTHIKVDLTQTEFDALVHWDYNIGLIHKGSLHDALNRNDKIGAGKAFMNYLKPSSLRGRRLKEQLLFQSGKYSQDAIPVYDSSSKHVRYTKPFEAMSQAKLLDLMGQKPSEPQVAENWFSKLFKS